MISSALRDIDGLVGNILLWWSLHGRVVLFANDPFATSRRPRTIARKSLGTVFDLSASSLIRGTMFVVTPAVGDGETPLFATMAILSQGSRDVHFRGLHCLGALQKVPRSPIGELGNLYCVCVCRRAMDIAAVSARLPLPLVPAASSSSAAMPGVRQASPQGQVETAFSLKEWALSQEASGSSIDSTGRVARSPPTSGSTAAGRVTFIERASC